MRFRVPLLGARIVAVLSLAAVTLSGRAQVLRTARSARRTLTDREPL